MNNQKEVTISDPLVTGPIEEIVVKADPLWRLQLVRILQIIGIALTFVGGAEALALFKLIPGELSAWLIASGAALRFGVEPLVLLIGDYADNGKLDKSFSIPSRFITTIVAAFCLFNLPSCSPMSFGVTEDGCALTSFRSEDGRKISTGPCVGPDGRVNRYLTEWIDQDGFHIRTVKWVATGKTNRYYKDGDGQWVELSAKSRPVL